MSAPEQQVSEQEIARLMGLTRRAVNKRLANTNHTRVAARGGRTKRYIVKDLPADMQAALLSSAPFSSLSVSEFSSATPVAEVFSFAYDRETLWDLAARRPQSMRDEGTRRAALLRQVIQLVSHGQTFGVAAQAVAQTNGVSAANLRNWYHGVNGRPGAKHYAECDWSAALIPGYAGRTATAECSPEAWDYYKADFLRLEQPAAAACYERLMRIAAERGWQVPSLVTLDRRLQREIPRAVQILARKGVEALQRSFPAQERDHSVFHALEAVNADGHKFDLFVRWPDGTIDRPVIVAWQCIYSGKILSHRVDHSEHSGLVRLSFGDMVERYGIPTHAYLDNGRSFAAKFLTGGTATRYRFKVREDDPVGILTDMLGPDGVHWVSPYHGQAKPIERAWLDLCEYVAKHPAFAGAYTGNKPGAKPENYASHAVPLDQFLRILEQEITAHNARAGRRSKVCAGRSFDQVFNESYARASIRKGTEEQRRLWLLAADGVTASSQDGSVRLFNNRYYCDALGQYAGQKIIARFDPDQLHTAVHAYTLDGRYIGRADWIPSHGFNSESAARDQARAVKQYRKANRAMLDAERRMSAIDAATYLPAPEPTDPPESKVVRAMFGDQIKKVANGDTVSIASDESRAQTESALNNWVNEELAKLRENAL